ncbi:MAG: ABC transporter substrate-binding protein [Treponema sp.]|nr:ABC transporter substrate-binding protein [Treponema sp.]
MKKLAVFWAVMAIVITLLIVTGCKKASGAAASTSGGKTPITFTFFNADATEDLPFNDPVAREITRQTGVTLNIDRPVGGNYQEVVGLMIASGELPDLIFAKGDLTMLIDAGMVIPLDDLIERKGSNLKKLYGNMLGRLKNTTEDPRIYNVGTYAVHNGMWSTDGIMQIQHAVLKELGYPRMKTLQDYENAIRTYLQRNPTINGRRTIGFSLLIDTWQWYIDLSNPSCFLLGYPDDGQWIVDQNTLEAYYKFFHPQAKEYYKWLNRINAEGILDPESFTQTEDEWRAKIASGRVLGIAYPLWGYEESRQSLVGDGMQERTFAYLPITLNENYQAASLMDPGFSGGWGVAITTSCKDPERAFEFLDWMASEEAQVLINWGIQGTNYNIVNGKRVMIESERNASVSDPNWGRRTGVGIYQHPFPMYGRGFIDSTNNFITRDSPETIRERYLDVEVETLAAYGAEMWTDLFPPTESLGVTRHGQAWQYALPPELNSLISEADDYVKTALSNMVLGRPADFDGAWDRMLTQLRRMGVENAHSAMTQLVRDKVRLWGN